MFTLKKEQFTQTLSFRWFDELSRKEMLHFLNKNLILTSSDSLFIWFFCWNYYFADIFLFLWNSRKCQKNVCTKLKYWFQSDMIILIRFYVFFSFYEHSVFWLTFHFVFLECGAVFFWISHKLLTRFWQPFTDFPKHYFISSLIFANYKTERSGVCAGMSQVCFLGPLLYTLYRFYISMYNKSKIATFADDTAV